MRRLAAVFLAAASIFGSSRLWADALTPERIPFAEPFASSDRSSAPSVVVVAAPEPHASRLLPKAVPKKRAKAAAAARSPRTTVVAPTALARVATQQRRVPTPVRQPPRPKTKPRPK